MGAITDKDGYYYFHSEAKDLIWKKFEPVFDTPFIQKVWAVATSDRSNAWTIFLEALSMGLKIPRAKDLAQKWGLDQKDFEEMLARIGKPTNEMQLGAHIFIRDILNLNVNEYWKELFNRED